MCHIQHGLRLDGEPVIRLESPLLRADVAPGVGGRIISLADRATGHEFLWRNQGLKLERLAPGSEYDPNFFGGIDELLPNDIPETIDGVACPDHGELWTQPLAWKSDATTLELAGRMPGSGLHYRKRLTLRADEPLLDLDYCITNGTTQPRHFLWKLHAALATEPGDVVDCPARTGQVVDQACSRFRTLVPFDWPRIEGCDASVVPPVAGTMDFFYLSGLAEGRMTWRRPGTGLEFSYLFDRRVFPYAWLFSTQGGFLGHTTTILEPCTTMPLSVNEASRLGQCSILLPGESLATRVSIRAGRLTTP